MFNDMNKPRMYQAKLNKSDREGEIPYDFICISNLKNKANEQTNKTNRLLRTENKLVVARGVWQENGQNR